ncbi:MAG: ABC transporter permease [Candidatus Kerfeldbacteria bacterium]|nr:ABC transporter permease [Candidatus Kerfeldbacteria bacterium]
MTTVRLTVASIKMYFRNRQSLFFTLFIPIVLMTIFGLIGFDRVPQIKVGVVQGQPNGATQQFLDGLKEVSTFDITVGGERDERTALEKGERAVVLLLPDALFPDPALPNPPTKQTLKVLTNVGQQQQAGTAVTILSQVLDKATIAMAGVPELFGIETEPVNARNQRYIDFLLPGIVAMAIMQMAVFSVSFVFVDYKERGILKRLLATPIKPLQFVTANVVTRLLVALMQAAVLVGMGIGIFHSRVIGSYWLILLIAILGGVMFLGLGFTISGIAKTVDAVPAIANLIVFPMLFLGGVFFPTDAMPAWLQRMVTYLPLSYFSHSLRDVMANGASIGAVSHDLYWMLGWSVVLVSLAMLTFRFEERRV